MIEPQSDWDWQSVVDWLMREGRLIAAPESFVHALVERIHGAGLSLCRLRITLHTLNPLVLGRSFTWWRDDAEIEVFEPPHQIIHTADYVGSPIEAVRNSGQPYRCRPQQLAPDQLHSSVRQQRERGVTDYLVLPLAFCYDDLDSTLIVSSDRPAGFSDADITGLNQLALYLAPVLETASQEITMQSLLNTYLGPRSAQRVRAGQIKRGDSERLQAIVWYSDLRDSTALTEALPEDRLLALLNDYFALISAAVTPRGGEILRFVGDALLVIFPLAPGGSAAAMAREALAAVRAAEQGRQQLNRRWTGQGVTEIRYGIGLDLGELVYGNVGAPQRLDFTVMGAAVNHAARIETLTKACHQPVLLSERLARLLPGQCQLVGQFAVAGVEGPLLLYKLRERLPGED